MLTSYGGIQPSLSDTNLGWSSCTKSPCTAVAWIPRSCTSIWRYGRYREYMSLQNDVSWISMGQFCRSSSGIKVIIPHFVAEVSSNKDTVEKLWMFPGQDYWNVQNGEIYHYPLSSGLSVIHHWYLHHILKSRMNKAI